MTDQTNRRDLFKGAAVAGAAAVAGPVFAQAAPAAAPAVPVQVEAALQEHPGVADSIVVGVPDEQWGEVVVAYVVRTPDRLPEDDVAAARRGDGDRHGEDEDREPARHARRAAGQRDRRRLARGAIRARRGRS